MSCCRGAEKEAKCVSEWRPKTRVLLPYIKGISEKIRRASHWVYRQPSLPGISSGNPSHSEWKTGNDGCEWLCVLNSLAATYVGETLKICMVEHKRVMKSNDFNNGITMHVQKTASHQLAEARN